MQQTGYEKSSPLTQSSLLVFIPAIKVEMHNQKHSHMTRLVEEMRLVENNANKCKARLMVELGHHTYSGEGKVKESLLT